MELNFKKVFSSPFSDDKWPIKVIFPAVMSILSFISNTWLQEHPMKTLVLFLIALIPGLILNGYFAQFGHNEIHDEIPLLPELGSGIEKFLKNGVKLFGVMTIYILIFALIASLLGIVLGVVAGLLNLKVIISILAIIIFIPLIVIAFAFLVVAECAFFDNFSFKEALTYKQILILLSKVKAETFAYILFFACFMMVTSICMSIVYLFPFVVLFAALFLAIVQLITINFKAQIYKIAKSRL